MSTLQLSLDQSINLTAYANFPAGSPPHGVTPNFVDPPKASLHLVVMGGILVAIMLFFAFCRAYYKIRVLHEVTWDDFCLLLGMLFTLQTYIGATMSATWGSAGINIWNLKVKNVANMGTALGCGLVEIGGSWAPVFIKGAFFVLFWIIFGQRRWMRLTLLIGGVFMTLINVSIAAVVTYFAAPAPGQDYIAYTATGRATFALKLAIPLSVIAIVTDLFLVIVPLIAVVGLQMAIKKKLAVIAVFMAAGLAIVASSLSLYFRVQMEKSNDLTGFLPTIFLCSVSEYTIGVCCACAPSVAHLTRVKSPLSSIRSRLASLMGRDSAQRSNQQTQPQSIMATPAVGPRQGRKQKRRRGPGRIFKSLGTVFPKSFGRTFNVDLDEPDASNEKKLDSLSTNALSTGTTGTEITDYSMASSAGSHSIFFIGSGASFAKSKSIMMSQNPPTMMSTSSDGRGVSTLNSVLSVDDSDIGSIMSDSPMLSRNAGTPLQTMHIGSNLDLASDYRPGAGAGAGRVLHPNPTSTAPLGRAAAGGTLLSQDHTVYEDEAEDRV